MGNVGKWVLFAEGLGRFPPNPGRGRGGKGKGTKEKEEKNGLTFEIFQKKKSGMGGGV